MSDWDAQQYLRFADERTRPVRDLVAQLPLAAPASIVDLGCGPGNSTAVLAERFPVASLVGLDNSGEMLEKARASLPALGWEQGDIATYAPATPPDLLFSNAALHWLPEHEQLFPRLLRQVAPGGCLAVQMPRNQDEPVHRVMRALGEQAPWADALGERRPITRVGTPGFYYDLLRPHAAAVEIWQTIYAHVMEGPDGIVEWMRGSGLRPYLEALPPDEAVRFQAAYREGIAAAYPPQRDGRVLLPFPRLFIVAIR